MKVSGQLHAPSALLSEKNPPVFKEQQKEWGRSRYGSFWKEIKILRQLGIELRISGRPPLTKLQYRLLTVPFRDLELQYVLSPIHKQMIRVVYVLRSTAYLCE